MTIKLVNVGTMIARHDVEKGILIDPPFGPWPRVEPSDDPALASQPFPYGIGGTEGIKVSEFGRSITYPVDESTLFGTAFKRLCKAKDDAIDWMTAKIFHDVGHTTPEPLWCYFCSFAYRFEHFWHEVSFWSSTCEGCKKVMYECGQACGFWDDY